MAADRLTVGHAAARTRLLVAGPKPVSGHGAGLRARWFLPDRDVAAAVAGEGGAVPVAPPLAQAQAGQPRHEAQLGRPHVAVRRAVRRKLALDGPVVMGHGELRCDVLDRKSVV